MKKILPVFFAAFCINAHAATYDLSVAAHSLPEYKLMGTNVSVTGEVHNLGTATITSFDLYYSVNGGAPVLKSYSGITFTSGNPFYFTHSTPYSIPATSGLYTFKIWATNMNSGNADEVTSNDTITYTMVVLSTLPTKKVLVEEGTGAWCGYCVDGAVTLQNILNSKSNAIGLAIHNGDAMSFTDGNTLNSTYAGGYPSGWVDRYLFDGFTTVGQSRSNWTTMANDRLTHVVPASVTINHTYNQSTRVITATVTANYYGITSGDQRVNLIIAEDSVSGSGTGYNQANYYNGTPGHPCYQKGNPIIGYQHRHVARHFAGGTWGSNLVIPASTTDGGSYSKVYTYTLPASVNENRVHLIATVQKYNTDIKKRAILNSAEQHLNIPTAINKNSMSAVSSLAVYPNPFSSVANIDFTLKQNENVNIVVMNILGDVVSSVNLGNLNSGNHYFKFNGEEFPSGIYFISVKTDSGEMTKKVSLTK